MSRVECVISGGQVGADIAGVRAGKRLGLRTGGWMPKGFRTGDGDRPAYAQEFAMREHSSRTYPPRTFKNVEMSDGTVRFAHNFQSPGEICTMHAIRQFGRPYFDVSVSEESREIVTPMVDFDHWLDTHGIATLNVAGNATRWLESLVEEWLVEALA